MIYQIKNQCIQKDDFVVLDQATFDLSVGNELVGTCIIGTIEDANKILAANQQAYLKQEASRFTICKEEMDSENNATWYAVDITQEPENANSVYQIFNTITGVHQKVIGLDATKTTLTQIKQDFLVFTHLDKVFEIFEFPKLPKILQQSNTSANT